MNIIQSIILAIVEGLTEFLPISSTAHMRFVSPLIGLDKPTPFNDMFDVVVQLAAILAVVILYRKKFLDFNRVSFYIKIILAMVPAVIVGYFFIHDIHAALNNLTFISWVMIGGGVVLLFIDKIFNHPIFDSEETINYRRAFVIGLGQVLAILFPGLSRSAATIITGMAQKLTRQEAAEFSFFLAVPTMFAASSKVFYDTYTKHPEVLGSQNLLVLLTGSVVAFIVAVLAIKFFIGFLKKHGFFVWGIYRIIIGIIMLILISKGIIAG